MLRLSARAAHYHHVVSSLRPIAVSVQPGLWPGTHYIHTALPAVNRRKPKKARELAVNDRPRRIPADHDQNSHDAPLRTRRNSTIRKSGNDGVAVDRSRSAKRNFEHKSPPRKGEVLTTAAIKKAGRLPSSDKYGIDFMRDGTAHRVLESAAMFIRAEWERLSPSSPANSKCRLSISCHDQPTIIAEGHGSSQKTSLAAAELNAIVQFYRSGRLKEILQGGLYNLPHIKAQRGFKPDDAFKIDVLNYAARFDYDVTIIPSSAKFYGTTGKMVKEHTCEVHIKALNLSAYARDSNQSRVEQIAMQGLKSMIERYHSDNVGGMLLVQDYTELNTNSAQQFVNFCGKKKNIGIEMTYREDPGKMPKGGHLALVSCAPWPENHIEEQAGQDLDMIRNTQDVTEIEEKMTKIFEGYRMTKTTTAAETAYLVAALEMRRKFPDIWRGFREKIRRGNGKIIDDLPELYQSVPRTSLSHVCNSLEQVHGWASAATSNLNLVSTTTASMPRRPYYKLDEEEIAGLNQFLQENLLAYESNPALSELRQKRAELPMVRHENEVLGMLNDNDVCVVIGATGSGKTTQLPQLILDEAIRENRGASCNIICTQPRRIAAISVAERVAFERNEALRQSVGYSVRFASQPPQPGGSIHYCTTGILLKRLQDGEDTALDGVSHVVVDEVHERDIQIDFLLIVLKRLLKAREAAGKSTIKVILMSATIDTSLFSKYFGDGYPNGRCPHIEVPGRTFPVTTHHLDEIYTTLRKVYTSKDIYELSSNDTKTYIDREITNPQYVAVGTAVTGKNGKELDTALIDWTSKGLVSEDGSVDLAHDRLETLTPTGLMSITIAHILKTTTEGSVLVFLPGLAEITALERLLLQTKPLGVEFGPHSNFQLYTLHSSMPSMQQEVFKKLEDGKRKIILATNIAETSITIPDVVYVVDSAKVRETQYDKQRRVSSLVSAWVAKSNAKQRAGRAGRVQHGHYYTMASESRSASLRAQPLPEVLRSDLKDLVLQISNTGIADIWGFIREAIQPPTETAVRTAIEELQALKALDDQELITPLGRLLSTLPISPSLGKMVVMGAMFKCLDSMIILAAASDGRDIFYSTPGTRDEVEAVRAVFANDTGNDMYAVINAFQQWRAIPDDRSRYEFSMNNHLHHKTLQSLAQSADQIMEALEKAGIVEVHTKRERRGRIPRYGSLKENEFSDNYELQTALATGGFYPNIAVQKRPGFLQTAHDADAVIHTNSLAAPRTKSGARYGRFDRDDVAPFGTLYTFTQKTQADGSGINLRGVGKTSFLAVMLFGGKAVRGSESRDEVIVDGWLPFSLKPMGVTTNLFRLNTFMQEYLDRTFAQLGNMSRERLLGLKAKQATILDDPVRDPLVQGIVRLLEEESGNDHRLLQSRGRNVRVDRGGRNFRLEREGSGRRRSAYM